MDFIDVPAFDGGGLFSTAKQVERSVSEHKVRPAARLCGVRR